MAQHLVQQTPPTRESHIAVKNYSRRVGQGNGLNIRLLLHFHRISIFQPFIACAATLYCSTWHDSKFFFEKKGNTSALTFLSGQFLKQYELQLDYRTGTALNVAHGVIATCIDLMPVLLLRHEQHAGPCLSRGTDSRGCSQFASMPLSSIPRSVDYALAQMVL
jgi:hypothetical protein